MEADEMEQKPIKLKRREFLRFGSLAVASLALAPHAGESLAQGSQPKLDEKDPQAQSLGYRHDATKVDKKKFAKYQAGETCSSCQLYQGKPGEPWGGCQIFSGKQVNAKGWCSAYVKKA
jgi:hypothetical protein